MVHVMEEIYPIARSSSFVKILSLSLRRIRPSMKSNSLNCAKLSELIFMVILVKDEKDMGKDET